MDVGVAPEGIGDYVNDCILKALAGITSAERPQFLKMVYNGPGRWKTSPATTRPA